jgi:hypothetical protein
MQHDRKMGEFLQQGNVAGTGKDYWDRMENDRYDATTDSGNQ